MKKVMKKAAERYKKWVDTGIRICYDNSVTASRVSTLTSAQQASQVYNYGMTGIVSIYPVL